MKLDLKDRKILYELDINCRQSFKAIGKKIGLSKESTFYRIKKLETEGIIQKYSTMVDVGKLGYTSIRMFLKFQNLNSNKEKEIINYLTKQKIVGWFVTIEGNWDINVWLLVKNMEELDIFWNEFRKKYINYIVKNQISIFTDITYFSKSYLLNRKNTKKFRFVTPPKEEKINKTDFEILKLLSPNSRISIIEIAEKLKISPRTVSSKIKDLERKKIIIGYKPLFDLNKLNYLYYKIHFKLHNLTKHKEEEFKNYIFQHPNIVYDNISIGGPDLEIDIQIESVQQLRDILKEIQDKYSTIIQNHEILQYLKEYKYMLLPVEF